MAESNELEEGEIQEDVEIVKVVSHMKPSFKNRRKFSSWGQPNFQPRVIQNKSITRRTVFLGNKNEDAAIRHVKPCLNVKDSSSEKKGGLDDIFNHNGLDSGYELDDYELLLIRHQLIQQQLKKFTPDDERMIVLSEYEAEGEKFFEETIVKKSEDDISLGKDVILLSDSSQNDDNDEEIELLRNILISQAKKKNENLNAKKSSELNNHISQNEFLLTKTAKSEGIENTSKLNCFLDSSEKMTETLDDLIKLSVPNEEFKIPSLIPNLASQSSKEKSLKKFRQRRAENKIRKEKKKIKRFEKIQTRSQTAAAEKGHKDTSFKLKVQAKRRKKKRGGKRSRLLAIRALHKDELKKYLHDQKEASKEDNYNNVPMEIDDEPSAYVDGFAPLPLIETTEVPPPLPTAPPSPIDSLFKPTVDIVPQYMTSSNVSWMPGYVESLYCDSESLAEGDKSNLKDVSMEKKKDFPDKVDEDEVWALRAQALKSLACKRAAKVKKMHKEILQEKNQKSDVDLKVNPNPKVISASSVVGLTNVDFKKFMPPKHAPVVIQLSKEDFESDDDGEQNISVESSKKSELDQLFQQARTESKKRTSSITKSGDELLIKNMRTCIEKSVAKMKKHSSSIVKDQLAYKKLQKVINEKRSSFTAINDSVKQLQDQLQAAIQERNCTKKIHNDLHAQFKVVKERLKEKIAVRNSVDENILKAKSIVSTATEESVILNDKMKQNVEGLMNTLTYFISQGDLPKQHTKHHQNYETKGYTSKISNPATHINTNLVAAENLATKTNLAVEEKTSIRNKMDLKKLKLLLRKKLNTHPKKNVLETLIQKEKKILTSEDLNDKNKIHQIVEESISIKALPGVKSMADLKGLQEKLLQCTESPISDIVLFDSLIDLFKYNSFIAPPDAETFASTCSISCESGLKRYTNNLYGSKYGNFELFSKYNSVLTNFKSYRLSPYYRTQSKYSLQSATFSNQINPHRVMCKYEVFGTCNDKSCTYWHFKDKCCLDQMNLMKDLVSYEPSMFGADRVTSTEKKQYLLSTFTKKNFAQYSGKMSSEEQLLLLWNQIREFRRSRKDAFYESISFNCRSWFIDQNVKSTEIHVHHYLKCFKPVYFLKKKSTNSQNMQSECQEVRYFSESYNSSEMLENAITKDPGSVKLWLSLAKLRLQQGKPDDTKKLSNREHALSVLSSSLEENRDSEELWIEYLNLVAKNTTSEELRELCYQAVMYAGTYNVWWTCLNLECTYLGKQEICSEMLTFIYDNSETIENLSHCLLETVLYAAQLLVSRNKIKLAVDYLASALGRESCDNISEKLYLEDITLKLSTEDKALLWICFISVKVFNELPRNLFLSEQSDSGRLVNKNKFVLNWKRKTLSLSINNDEIHGIFYDAIQSFGNVFLKPTFILHENMVAFEMSIDQQKKAIQHLRTIVKEEPSFVEGWVLLLSIYIKHSPTDVIVTLAEEALRKCNYDAEIVYFYSSWLYKENLSKLALEKLTRCVHVFFELPNDVKDVPDVLHLYQKILGLSIPYSITLPTYIPKISEHLIFYCWMCYCLVLKIKNISPTLHIFSTAVDEAFECAVHRYTSRQYTKKLWLAYIKHKLCFLNSLDVSKDKFLDLLYRCLASVAASEVTVHYIHLKDYSFHNKLLDLCLPYINLDAHAQFFQKTLRLMPDNVYHALRVSQFEFDQKNYNQARFICGTVLNDFPKFLPLWRMAIQIELKCDNIQEARWLFGEATKSLPFISLLWKEYLKFEVSNAKDSDKLNDVLDAILSKCKENGISLVDESSDENLFAFFVT